MRKTRPYKKSTSLGSNPEANAGPQSVEDSSKSKKESVKQKKSSPSRQYKQNMKVKFNTAAAIEKDFPLRVVASNHHEPFSSDTRASDNIENPSRRLKSISSGYPLEEVTFPMNERKSREEELYNARIATLSMMEDAVEAKKRLEIMNQKLHEEIAERIRSEKIQQILYAISNAVLTTKDVDELIGIFKEQLGKLLDTTNFYVAFYDESSGMLNTTNASDAKDSIDSWPAEKSLTGLVILQKKSLLLTYEQINELNLHGIINIIGTPAKVWLGVPLEVNGKTIGAFVIQNYEDRNAFTKKDMDMLEFISNQVSISIQRKKAVQDLTEALLKAEENDRLKTAFLNNISHEIRTPMNAIIGFSELLREPGLDTDGQQEYTGIIINATNQLLSIIEDIINISAVDAGQEILRPAEINLNSLLKNLKNQFLNKIKTLNISLELSTPLNDSSVQIVTDNTKLWHIISNLLNNAVKFTTRGQISFGYTLEGDFLQFYVKDTGIGIPEHLYTAIFDRFRQADSSISRKYGGTGLGLSISKAYVELLGGKIWLNSKIGEGSTFYFSIPYNPVNTDSNANNTHNEVKGFVPITQISFPCSQNAEYKPGFREKIAKWMFSRTLIIFKNWDALVSSKPGKRSVYS